MMKWFLMEHRSDALGLASVPVKRSDGITQTFDTEDAAITAAVNADRNPHFFAGT
jgi:hypothetical protein